MARNTGMRRGWIVIVVVAITLGSLLLVSIPLVIGPKWVETQRARWPTLSPLEVRFGRMQIQSEDLPSGWRLVELYSENVSGAEARFASFSGSSDPDEYRIRLYQEIVIYPTAAAADDAYWGWVDDVIPPAHAEDWILPPELESRYYADQIVVACLVYAPKPSFHDCTVIGRYGDTIVILSGAFYDQYMTMAEFSSLVEVMDRRVAAVMEEEREQPER